MSDSSGVRDPRAVVDKVRSVVNVKRAGVWLAVLGVLAGLVSPAGAAAPSPEQRQRDIAAEVRKLHEQIGEAADQEAETLAELTVSRRLRAQLDAEVASLDAALVASQAELAQLDRQLEEAVAAEGRAQAAVEAAERDLEEATELLRDQAVRAFMRYGNTPSVTQLVLDVDDVNDVTRIYAYVDAVAERQATVVERHRRLQEDTTVLRARAAEAKSAVAAHQAEVRARTAELEATRARQAAARAEVAAEAAIEQRLLAQVQARRGDYERRVSQLERESNEIAALLRRRQASQRVTPGGRGVLAYPLADPVVTSSFGYRIHPIYGNRRLHAGVDLRAPTGTAVYAAGAGVVAYAGWMTGYGNTVVIDHGGQLATLYAHNSRLTVVTGESVSRQERIALAGSTGNSTGPHVHFEVRVGGAPVDPLGYL